MMENVYPVDIDEKARIHRRNFYLCGGMSIITGVTWGCTHFALQNYVFHLQAVRKLGYPVNLSGLPKGVSFKKHLFLFMFLNTRYFVLEEFTKRRKSVGSYLLSTSVFSLFEYPIEGLLHRMMASRYNNEIEVFGWKWENFFDLRGFLFKVASHLVFDGVMHGCNLLFSKLLGIQSGEEPRFHEGVLSVFGYEFSDGRLHLKDEEETTDEEEGKGYWFFDTNFLYGVTRVIGAALGTLLSHPLKIFTLQRQCGVPNQSLKLKNGLFTEFFGSVATKGSFLMGVIPIVLLTISLNSFAAAIEMRKDRFTRKHRMIEESKEEDITIDHVELD